jgi:diaminohydroxyphosphoribosylaminopyrimidine deaminase/5-amino-6-(5-phosphoribosylamino)uracil reductase
MIFHMRRGEDEERMRRCFALAKKGVGAVSPNPVVGALVVLNGKVLGKGFHEKYGGPHAEVNAIRDALRRHSSIQGAILYVNLEPCVHHGKTPPCVDAIVRYGIRKVVAAIQDPNPRVAGKGFRALRRAGVSVVTGLLRSEAEILNEKFSRYITAGTPFVAIKAAQTRDGFIAWRDGSSRWISSKKSRTLVHRLRSEYDAVLVGAGTAIADNPQLTVRHIKGRNPVRVLVDGRLRTPLTAHLFNDKFRRKTIVLTGKSNAKRINELRHRGVQVIVVNGKINGVIPVDRILKELAKKGIASLLVEGGQIMYRQFLQRRAVQKIYLFTSPKKFNDGIRLFDDVKNSFRIVRKTDRRVGRDHYLEGYISYRKGN